jgi:phosphoribosylformimino-5-aminoimidazole carboxamide ribotide isomerase
MIVPCIDLMGGKVVQLVQGRDKALEAAPPEEMLRRFAAFPEIQVIDLDAAIGQGENTAMVEPLARLARVRIGGGVRTADRAAALVRAGAHRVIVGTSAFTAEGVNHGILREISEAAGSARVVIALDTLRGQIVVKGWRESLPLTPAQVMQELEPYCSGFLCTYVDREGLMQGTDLDWFRRLRTLTKHEITAAGGITTVAEIQALLDAGIHAAIGMAVYTGRLDLEELAALPGALET